MIQADDIWGKSDPYQALITHMFDVGMMAQSLATHGTMSRGFAVQCTQIGWPFKQSLTFLGYLAAMHDIGKVHPIFQCQWGPFYRRLPAYMRQATASTPFRHEKYSRLLLKDYLKQHGVGITQARCFSAVDGLHHQGKSGDGSHIRYGKEEWLTLQQAIESRVYKCFPFDAKIVNVCPKIDALCMQLLGIIILSDWLVSGDKYIPPSDHQCDANYLDAAQTAALYTIHDCGLQMETLLPIWDDYTPLFPRKAFQPRPLQKVVQKTISQTIPTLMIIEAPMGEGKTEAALYAASRMGEGMRGIYVALPTGATSNQMHSRLNEIFIDAQLPGLRLLHGAAWLVESPMTFNIETGLHEEPIRWLQPLRRAMLSMNAVGTVDQAMLSVMLVKYGMLRLLGLSGKVLIIDEVHAYDTYMSVILERLLSWCAAFRVPVILLSATLPIARRSALIKAYAGEDFDCLSAAYPLLTTFTQNAIQETQMTASSEAHHIMVSIMPILDDDERIASQALSLIVEGGCLCVLVNTVTKAQAVFSALKNTASTDTELMLFHARFMAGDRKAIEERTVHAFGKDGVRPQKAILVATQVCEQSIDLDFDIMMTSLAPMDLLLQRLGRVHRHERQRPQALTTPQLLVLTRDKDGFGVDAYVYEEWALHKAYQIVSKLLSIALPDDIRPLVEEAYDGISPRTDAEMQQFFTAHTHDQQQVSQGQSVIYGMPRCQSFGLADYVDPLLAEDENAHIAHAATRLGESSRMALFIDESELFDFDSKKPCDLVKARKWMLNGVALRESLLATNPASGYAPPIGKSVPLKGVFAGCVIYPMRDSVYRTKDQRVQGYRLDNELGVIIERS